jgi:hypothetical protein
MSNQLEKFVQRNRAAFDEAEPNPQLWESIETQLKPAKPLRQKGIYISMKTVHMAAAACLLLAISIVGYWLSNRQKINDVALAIQKKPTVHTITETNQPNIDSNPTVVPPSTVKTQAEALSFPSSKNSMAGTTNKDDRAEEGSPAFIVKNLASYEQSTQHFTQLIAHKQVALRRLQKTNPLLYKEFLNDMAELELSYKGMKKHLPKAENQPCIIKAMINNLQLQIEVLNKQLIITHQIEFNQKQAMPNERNI